MGDLRWMRQNGLEAAVKSWRRISGLGICGGYQMRGRTISDPHGVENENSLREPLYPAHCEAISHEPDIIAVERIKRDGALPLRGMELPLVRLGGNRTQRMRIRYANRCVVWN